MLCLLKSKLYFYVDIILFPYITPEKIWLRLALLADDSKYNLPRFIENIQQNSGKEVNTEPLEYYSVITQMIIHFVKQTSASKSILAL